MSEATTRSRLGWGWTLLLFLPVLVPYVGHVARAAIDGDLGSATGFLHYEGRYYVANAREHTDGGSFHWAYGNPCSPDPETPRLFAQPMSLALGALLSVVDVEPGWLYAAFGWLCALIAVRLAVAVYGELVGHSARGARLGLVCLLWGGGLFTVAGVAFSLLAGRPLDPELVFALDPFDGWWCLNLGRNLVLPTEALYHALALGAFLAWIRGRGAVATLLLVVLSASHPFTGVQMLLATLVFLVVECFFMERRSAAAPAVVVALLVALHLGYYLAFLPASSAEHRALMERWTLPWTLNAAQLLAAYTLVGGLALARLCPATRAGEVLREPRWRFLLVFFVVSFALANHEFLIEPVQPIHFSRGYLWTPLFLLGAPLLVRVLGRVGDARWPRLGRGGDRVDPAARQRGVARLAGGVAGGRALPRPR